MKKVYNAPSVKMVDLASEGLMAGSQDKVGIGSGKIDAGGAYSHEKDLWGNESIWK